MMNTDGYSNTISLNQYISQTFSWMFLGLLTTFSLSYAIVYSGLVTYFLTSGVVTLLLIAELIVVMVLSTNILKRSIETTTMLFMLYSVLNGLVFSALFVAYDVFNIVLIFGLTSLFFGAFAVYGKFTKRDLSTLFPFLFGSLIFLVVAGILILFIPSTRFEKIISMIGIVVFLGFTAYDTQMVIRNYEYFQHDDELLQKASIFSALELYLDFINLFLYLLRFLGKGSNSKK